MPKSKCSRYVFLALIIMLSLFQVQDAACTYIGVSHFGIGIEANPLMAWLMQIFGTIFGLVLPKSICLAFLIVLYRCALKDKLITWSTYIVLIIMNCVYFKVAIDWFTLLFDQGLL